VYFTQVLTVRKTGFWAVRLVRVKSLVALEMVWTRICITIQYKREKGVIKGYSKGEWVKEMSMRK
jgi:hypothetical protein